MITRILVTPGAAAWLAGGDGSRSAELADAAGELGAAGVPDPPQPAARQPASPAPISAASQRDAGMLRIDFTLSARSRWQATCGPAPGQGGSAASEHERPGRDPPGSPVGPEP